MSRSGPWQEHLSELNAARLRARKLEAVRRGEIHLEELEDEGPCGHTPDGNEHCRLPYGHEGPHVYK